jgi:hypothetical protein
MRTLLTFFVALSISCFAQSDGRTLYQQAMNALSGSGVERSGYNAVNLMRRAAETGYAPAQTALGYWLQNGQYVAGSPTEAVEWYRRAAKQNDRFAEYALGRAYALGIGGPKDDSQAEVWLRKAADAGDPFAKFYTATVLESRDPRQSVAWLQKAADDGIPQAYAKLGIALLEGRAVARDPRAAYTWLVIAQLSGANGLDDRLRLLETELGNAIDDLRARARDRADALRTKRLGSGCTGWDGEMDDLPKPPPPEIQRNCR